MHIIHTNVPITRRKSFFLVTNEQGRVIFRDRHFWPCIAFLDAIDQTEYELRPGDEKAPEGASPSLVAQRKRTWQK